MTTANHLLGIAQQYLAAIESGVPGAAQPFFTDDVVQHEFPNRLVPNGATRDLTQLAEAAERGRKVVRTQRFEILNSIEQGNWLALETRWIATMNIAIGTIPEGGEMTARFGVFLEFRDGKICKQHNYDCFDPF